MVITKVLGWEMGWVGSRKEIDVIIKEQPVPRGD